MGKESQEVKEYDKLLGFIAEQLLRKGIKATTMDSLATELQMSKRTLYEIFESKENMVDRALKNFHDKLAASHRQIFESSDNIMEAMTRILASTRNWMSHASVNFFRDIDEYFAASKRKKEAEDCRYAEMEKIFSEGAREGFFRKDINFLISCRLLTIQMESLKRMEELFPPDITLLEAYDSISIGFLRSISSQKGLEYLDNMKLDDFKNKVSKEFISQN